MRTGIVLEIHKNYVTVLADSGEFLKLRKSKNLHIGDVYCEKAYHNNKNLITAAAVLILTVLSFSGYNAYARQIVGYVDVKQDSKTIRLYYDRMGRIEKADGFDVSKIKNKSVKAAVESVNDKIKKDNADVKNVPNTPTENSSNEPKNNISKENGSNSSENKSSNQNKASENSNSNNKTINNSENNKNNAGSIKSNPSSNDSNTKDNSKNNKGNSSTDTKGNTENTKNSSNKTEDNSNNSTQKNIGNSKGKK